jgi:hypothetical protein
VAGTSLDPIRERTAVTFFNFNLILSLAAQAIFSLWFQQRTSFNFSSLCYFTLLEAILCRKKAGSIPFARRFFEDSGNAVGLWLLIGPFDPSSIYNLLCHDLAMLNRIKVYAIKLSFECDAI